MPSTLPRARRPRARLVAILASVLAAASLASAGPASALPISWNARLDLCRFTYQGPNGVIRFQVVRPDGTVRFQAQRTVQTGSENLRCTGVLVPGEKLIAQQVISPTNIKTISTFQIPNFSLSVDRTTDVITVRGQNGTAISVAVWDCGAGGVACVEGPSYSRTIGQSPDAAGVATVDTTAEQDLDGADQVMVSTSGSPSTIMLFQRVAHLEATLGSAKVAGTATVASVPLTLRGATGSTVKASAKGTSNRMTGAFAATLKNAAGTAVKVKAGDRLSSSAIPGATLAVPADLAVDVSFGSLDHDDGTVLGQCLANGPYSVAARTPAKVSHGEGRGVAEADGSVIDISLVGQVVAGDTVTLRCANAAGDWVTIPTIA